MKRALVAVTAALAAALIMAPVASAIDDVNTNRLRRAVTLDGILEHERALQRIATANDDNRAATTAGYDDSVAYVSRRLRAAGYDVSLDGFDFPLFTLNSAIAVRGLAHRAHLRAGHGLHRGPVRGVGGRDGEHRAHQRHRDPAPGWSRQRHERL